MQIAFEKNDFKRRFTSMLKVDLKRMLISPFSYIMVGIALAVPILILVMTTMMDGSVSVNPQTGKETVMEGFKNVWQILGSTSSASADPSKAMSMDLVSMCNINMMYFAVAVLVCVFVADDFRSGYAKNLFTVRANKIDYVASKSIVCFLGGAVMILAFVIGSLLGGKFAGLPFVMEGFDVVNLITSVITKMVLVGIFVPIYLIMSVIAKSRLWLSILLSLGVGMFLFNIAPMVSPLDATAVHFVLALAGSLLFSVGLGAVSNLILKKTALI